MRDELVRFIDCLAYSLTGFISYMMSKGGLGQWKATHSDTVLWTDFLRSTLVGTCDWWLLVSVVVADVVAECVLRMPSSICTGDQEEIHEIKSEKDFK